MPSQPRSENSMPVHHGRLATMIDTLVAVQMDLKALCDRPADAVAGGRSQSITEACAVLQSAIDELKEVIRELEGTSGMVDPASPSSQGSSVV
jgi:hypothetical protein